VGKSINNVPFVTPSKEHSSVLLIILISLVISDIAVHKSLPIPVLFLPTLLFYFLFGGKMAEIMLQIYLAIAMFITTAVAGLFPLKVLHLIHKDQDQPSKKASWILTLLSCFAGGVFMGTCFLDIFPHVNANFNRFRANIGMDISYPFPEFFACIGFFLVYFLEELCLKVFSTSSHGHSHGPATSAPTGLATNSCAEPAPRPTSSGNGHSVESGNGVVSNVEDKETPEKYMAVQTHEIVMEDIARYASSDVGEGGFLKSITFAIAMSFHSILEGFALGVQDNHTGVLTLFISLIIHKSIEAFSVGLQISKSHSKRIYMVITTILIYALMTPVGSMIGVILTNIEISPITKDAVIVVLEGMSGGTFIYVTFFEVLAQERANDHSNLIQLNAILLGFLVIAGLQVNEHFGGEE
jgi:zinc transporter 1/2/3